MVSNLLLDTLSPACDNICMPLPFLSKKESDIYQLLLKEGELPVHAIVTKTKLKRGIVYKSLYTLEEKGLATKNDIRKKIHFKPASPTELSRLVDIKTQEASQARLELNSMLPELTQLYITTVEKPVVTTYQGVDGLKKIYEDTLKVREPIYAALTTSTVEPALVSWLNRTYTKKRIEARISVKVIVASGRLAEQYTKRDNKELRETRLVSGKSFPFKHEVDIYGDKIAFIDFRKGGSLIGIVIHHPGIATTMRALWQLAWLKSDLLTPVAA
jgi:sugar-specific transcriptional regulator TrmB